MKTSIYYASIISLTFFLAGCSTTKSAISETKTSTERNGIPLIIDADTANEVDDLYAIVRALIAPELNVLGITAAQFHTSALATCESAKESQKVNEDIVKLMGKTEVAVLQGSNSPLANTKTPRMSQAAQFIIDQAHSMPKNEKLHIAILGPCTNVASAILQDPSIAQKIEVSYIGFWHDKEKNGWDRMEFNSSNDQKAVDVLLSTKGLAFNVMTATTSGALKFELSTAESYLSGKGGIKEFLQHRWNSFNPYWKEDPADKKEWTMWDVAIIEALIHPENAMKVPFSIPVDNTAKNIIAYTSINAEAMKSSYWTAIDGLTNSVDENYLVVDVSVLTMKDEIILRHQDVFVQNGKIKFIGDRGIVKTPSNVQVISGRNRFLMPGLSEMHAHIPVPGEDVDEDDVEETLMLYLANGITLIRGMLGNPYHLELRKKVKSGEIIGPRIYTSSPSMNGGVLKTEEDAIEAVRSAKETGYDFLKIHPGIKLNVMEALVNAANETGIKYAGHVPEDVGIERALIYGYESVDHVDGYVQALVPDDTQVDRSDPGFFGSNLMNHVDFNRMDHLTRLTKDNNVWLVPTQTLFTRWLSPISAVEMMQAKEFEYLSSKTRFAWRTSKERMNANLKYDEATYNKFIELRQNIIKSLYQKGVGLLLGSDAPQVMNVPGFSIHHEIEAMIDCGIPVFEIIKSGTANPAVFFGDTGIYGTIQEGADADFILVSANPLESPETMKNPLGTMIGGKWLNKSYFAKRLEELASKHSD